MVRILLAPTLELARSVSPAPAITIEAEYGDVVVKGGRYTAAHHGPREGNLCPCVDHNIPRAQEGEVILVSHMDLDTLGGIAQAERVKTDDTDDRDFWALAAYVDMEGPHKARNFLPHVPHGLATTPEERFEYNAWARRDAALEKLYAWWAWSKTGVPRYSRDKVSDITCDVTMALAALHRCMHYDRELLAAGEAFKAAEKALNTASFVRIIDGEVVVRKSSDFCNHLYGDPTTGAVGMAVVAFNTTNSAITVSLAEPTPGVSCREIVQGLWGATAGGHDGIAGSPRGKAMTEADLDVAASAMVVALAKD